MSTIELIRTFFIFSFAVVAFSQYLRTSSNGIVNELRQRSRDIDAALLRSANDKVRAAAEDGNYKEAKRKLFSDECDVPHDTAWYYVLFFYLAASIAISAALPLLAGLGYTIWGSTDHLMANMDVYLAAYCVLGMLLNFMVFRAGFRAIKPKEKARETLGQLETMADALRMFE